MSVQTELIAHSSRFGISKQSYEQHIAEVRRRARSNVVAASAFFQGDAAGFVEDVDSAALLHDLGKVDELNQDVLNSNSKNALPLKHEDAGVAELLRLQRFESAILVAAHHAGLFSQEAEAKKPDELAFRDVRYCDEIGGKVCQRVDGRIDQYLELHDGANCDRPPLKSIDDHREVDGFTRRLALSCLVDADHGDTARHYGREVKTRNVETKWAERLNALDRYVAALPAGITTLEKERNSVRGEFYQACRNAPADPSIRECDAPVGSGKTTAVMAHLLNVAAVRDPELRHIFVVMPYTNIVTQAVEVLRRAIVLEGERPEDVVAEHHHRADFKDVELRQLATLWQAPVIVTTAVQFFETLGSNHPSRLRKLHELPGSAVFVDEAHAAMPSYLWPQMWRWLQTWTHAWGGYAVLASGSLPRFWEIDDYRELITDDSTQIKVSGLADAKLGQRLAGMERSRIHYRRRPKDAPALNCEELIQFVHEKDPKGPRLLIVNTVQTAAVIAQMMREESHNVLHLSTALAPIHRDAIVRRIKWRLRDRIPDWTLVATSCVEAGMDFSFRSGFRERSSTASLIQIGGRVNRGNDFNDCDSEVWDILLRDEQFRDNPTITTSRYALDHFSLQELNDTPPSHLASKAMAREFTEGGRRRALELVVAEEQMEYPTVNDLCRVIESDTRLVVVDAKLATSIERKERVSKAELLAYSVQIWVKKINKLGLRKIDDHYEIYDCSECYGSEFLGYMKSVLQNEQFLNDPEACVI